ncbi:MAG: alpha/beta hydrolase family protein [Candidatus Binatia bacterium]
MATSAVTLCLSLGVTGALAPATAQGPHGLFPEAPDCTGPARDPEPGTPEWEEREATNVYCGYQRPLDLATNPAYPLAMAGLVSRNADDLHPLMDPFRDPRLWSGKRFRYAKTSFTGEAGENIPGAFFLPCDDSCDALPESLSLHHPPYPGVVITHGGAARHEMYFWAAEGLAEAGYVVLMLQIPTTAGFHYSATRAALEYLLSSEESPTPTGEFDPFRAELDATRLGLAGHSAGGVAVSRLGQEDDRIDAIVSWDRAQSTSLREQQNEAGFLVHTPALFLAADFNCQRVPVCLPERRAERQDPHGPGDKDDDFELVRAAGVDAMKITLRAATHLDFTDFFPAPASRYGTAVVFYYTLAWLDRYVKAALDGTESEEVEAERGAIAAGALARLVAATFDDSADVHNLSGARWSAETLDNRPERIAGLQVADRLSFHFRSAYDLAGGTHECEEMRAGCP